MSEAQDPRKANSGEEIEAVEWNRMRRASLRRVTGPNVVETPDGFHIRDVPRLQNQTVVLVRDPLVDDKSLWVRAVKYATEGEPEAGAYDWAGDPFFAYPEFGFEIIHYGQFYWKPPDRPTGLQTDAPWDPPPVLDTTFLSARFRGGVWIADQTPATGLRFVVIVDLIGNDSPVVKVREVVASPDAVGAFEIVGPVLVVNVWPKFKSRHYKNLEWIGAAVTNETHVLPLVRMGSQWHVKPLHKIPSGPLDPDLPMSDCKEPE